jgi:hypothetical protein
VDVDAAVAVDDGELGLPPAGVGASPKRIAAEGISDKEISAPRDASPLLASRIGLTTATPDHTSFPARGRLSRAPLIMDIRIAATYYGPEDIDVEAFEEPYVGLRSSPSKRQARRRPVQLVRHLTLPDHLSPDGC